MSYSQTDVMRRISKGGLANIASPLLILAPCVSAFAEVLNLLSVDYLTPDDFFCPAHDAVHGLDPVPLRLTLQILGYALTLSHLADDELVASSRLFVQISKIDV